MLGFYSDHEWIQRASFRYDDAGGIAGACLGGAFRAVMIPDDPAHLQPDEDAGDYARMAHLAGKILASQLPGADSWGEWMQVIDFNDDPGTTREKALALLRKAIEAS